MKTAIQKPWPPSTTVRIKYLRDGELWVGETTPGVWAASWYPHRHDHPDYPGVTVDSEHERIPVSDGVDAIVEWAEGRLAREDSRIVAEVALEQEASDDEVAEIERLFDEVGAPAIVTASIGRRSGAPDLLPWAMLLKVPLGRFPYSPSLKCRHRRLGRAQEIHGSCLRFPASG